MRCFYHHDREAIGTCKSCNKGICPDCAVDLTKGLACKDYCEEEVKEMIALIDHNIANRARSASILGNMKSNTYAQGVFYGVFGSLIVVIGNLVGDGDFSSPLSLMGYAFLAYGAFVIWRAYRLPK